MSETLWGVIIGAAAAIIGGVIGQLISHWLENRRYKKNKRIEAFESIYRYISMASGGLEMMDKSAVVKSVEDAGTKVFLYTNFQVRQLFSRVTELLREPELSDTQTDELHKASIMLGELIRKQIGFKD